MKDRIVELKETSENITFQQKAELIIKEYAFALRQKETDGFIYNINHAKECALIGIELNIEFNYGTLRHQFLADLKQEVIKYEG